MINQSKKNFLKSEAWALTLSGGFGRANVYKSNNPEDVNRVYFKTKLRGFLDHLAETHYQTGNLSDAEHIDNIKKVQEFTTSFSTLLNNGCLNFGVCQKLLTLHLKYHWCLGYVTEPPHFPVDRIIQQLLSIKPLIAWTKMETEDEYMQIINKARLALKETYSDYNSLPEIKLNVFARRNM